MNNFYASLETISSLWINSDKAELNELVLSVRFLSEHDVRRASKHVNIKKTTGPEGVNGRVLKLLADQLVPVFTMIFNLSLAQSVIPTRFKSTIIPVLKFCALMFFLDLIFSADGSMIRLHRSPDIEHHCFEPCWKVKGVEIRRLVIIEAMTFHF